MKFQFVVICKIFAHFPLALDSCMNYILQGASPLNAYNLRGSIRVMILGFDDHPLLSLMVMF